MAIRRRAAWAASAAAVAIAAVIVLDALIWHSDWNQFIPDLLVAVVTGLIIGLVLWQVEITASSERDLREIRRNWGALRGRVASAIRQGYTYVPGQARLEGYGIQAIRQAVDSRPIHSWLDVLDAIELRILIDFLAAADELDDIASSLQASMNTASVTFAPRRPKPNLVAIEVALTHVDRNREFIAPSKALADEVWSILADPGVTQYATEFRSAGLLVESLWIDLTEALRGASWSSTRFTIDE